MPSRSRVGNALAVVLPSIAILVTWLVYRPSPQVEPPPFRFSTSGPLESASAKSPSVAAVTVPDGSAAREREKKSRAESDAARREHERAVSAQLLALRDAPDGGPSGCFRFESVGVRAAQRRRIRERKATTDCDYTEKAVKCLETNLGYFVPFDLGDGYCNHELWFVPDAKHDTEYHPAQLGESYPESDIQFTVGFLADDIDLDGVVEAVLVRRYEHPEGVSHGQATFALEPSGEVSELPFDDVSDVDGDGHADGLFTTDFQQNSGGACDPPDVFNAWSPEDLTGPTLVAHRQLDGTFSIADDFSRRELSKVCSGLPPGLVARDAAGAIDEQRTLTRLVCQLQQGVAPEPLVQELEGACAHYFERVDCKARRPDSCRFGSFLTGFARRFESLPKKLFPP